MAVIEPGAPTAIEGEIDTSSSEALGAARPLRADVWRRFRRNRMAMVGLAFVVLLVLVAIFAPLIAPYGFDERTGDSEVGPSMEHFFGTDSLGYDLFSRVVYGARVSLRIGIVATLLTMVIGVLVGGTAGFMGSTAGALGRYIDTGLMRFVDVFLAIPYIILAVAIATIMDRSQNTVIIVLGVTAWLPVSRIVRSSFLALGKVEYVEAAEALGLSRWRIALRHVLPNALQPIIVYGTISIGALILNEAALSFLQVGPQPPTPAWGLMVSEAKGEISSNPHLLFFPGAAIFLTVVAFVFIGDGLRDALDPKLK
jgi:peptide/nickel transport system permease protein